MIHRAENMDIEVRERMKDGKGAVQVTHLLRQIQMKGKCRFFGKMLLEEGCSIGLHQHKEEEEIYYVVRGRGIVVDNGIRQEVKQGDIILTGGGAAHSIENLSKEVLEVIGVILTY